MLSSFAAKKCSGLVARLRGEQRQQSQGSRNKPSHSSSTNSSATTSEADDNDDDEMTEAFVVAANELLSLSNQIVTFSQEEKKDEDANHVNIVNSKQDNSKADDNADDDLAFFDALSDEDKHDEGEERVWQEPVVLAKNEGADYTSTGKPMTRFPEGAVLGGVTNCWGPCDHVTFQVRGSNYLQDGKKVPSQEFLWPIRGCELLLTEHLVANGGEVPVNVGRDSRLFEGKLRDVPTFIMNFRLPWGVMLCYFEIPSRFIPYLKAGYKDETTDEQYQQLVKAIDDMTPGDRCVCRFLLGSTAHKNATLKIIPMVVQGPWIVQQVVTGKPAIIGNKMPIDYVYEPAVVGADDDKDNNRIQHPYLEADLHLSASTAACGILSLVKHYISVLTLDLAFVVQGNSEDELPEQMLAGYRLHGADPISAPLFPATTSLHDGDSNTNQEEENTTE